MLERFVQENEILRLIVELRCEAYRIMLVVSEYNFDIATFPPYLWSRLWTLNLTDLTFDGKWNGLGFTNIIFQTKVIPIS